MNLNDRLVNIHTGEKGEIIIIELWQDVCLIRTERGDYFWNKESLAEHWRKDDQD